MAINNAIYTKNAASSTTATALSTANPEKYDSWQFFNDDAAIVQTFAVNGASVKVLAGETVGVDIRCSPNAVTVASASGTPSYRVIALGR